MIGDLVRACDQARSDARRGEKQRLEARSWRARAVYLDAWRRELATMAREGRLPQTELQLAPAAAQFALRAGGETV